MSTRIQQVADAKIHGSPPRLKQITLGGVLIAAFLIAASFYVSRAISDRFADLEREALSQQVDQAFLDLVRTFDERIYQTQFATFEDLPQTLADTIDPADFAAPFSRLRTGVLDLHSALLFGPDQAFIAGIVSPARGEHAPLPPTHPLVQKISTYLTAAGPDQSYAFFIEGTSSPLLVTTSPVVSWKERPTGTPEPVGAIVFCHPLGAGFTTSIPGLTVEYSIAETDGAKASGTPMRPLPVSAASWNPTTPIRIAFPSTTASLSSMTPADRLFELQRLQGAGWLVNLVLENQAPITLHQQFATIVPHLAPQDPASPRSSVTALLNQPPRLPALRITMGFPADLSSAVAGSKRLVQSLFFIAAALICVFTTFVLREIQRRFRAERDLAESNLQKDQLLSVIAHDLRAPITGVGNLAQLMSKTGDSFTPADIRSFAGEIQLTTKRLTELLENLLSWAHLKSGRHPISPATVDLPRLVGQVIRLFAPASSAGSLTVTAAMGHVTTVHSDPEILRTILRNLLSNAVKHTPAGGTILVTAERSNNDLSFSVVDSGPGIPPEEIDSILSSQRESLPQGKGFGLVLCREMADLLGGTISAQNLSSGSGLSISVRLPGACPGSPPQNDPNLDPA